MFACGGSVLSLLLRAPASAAAEAARISPAVVIIKVCERGPDCCLASKILRRSNRTVRECLPTPRGCGVCRAAAYSCVPEPRSDPQAPRPATEQARALAPGGLKPQDHLLRPAPPSEFGFHFLSGAARPLMCSTGGGGGGGDSAESDDAMSAARVKKPHLCTEVRGGGGVCGFGGVFFFGRWSCGPAAALGMCRHAVWRAG